MLRTVFNQLYHMIRFVVVWKVNPTDSNGQRLEPVGILPNKTVMSLLTLTFSTIFGNCPH